MADEAFDGLTEDVGGVDNAFTAPDVTADLAEAPSNHLERMIWAGAERLAHLNVDAAKFASERDVVKEECRRRAHADPYGRLFNELPTLGFIRHPYRRPGIGILAGRDAATLDDVRAFTAPATGPTTWRWSWPAASTQRRWTAWSTADSAAGRSPQAACRAATPPSRGARRTGGWC